nr:uncharacterized protein CFP56_76957 [Quercus suber]
MPNVRKKYFRVMLPLKSSLELSHEEVAELSRSTKKVKEYHSNELSLNPDSKGMVPLLLLEMESESSVELSEQVLLLSTSPEKLNNVSELCGQIFLSLREDHDAVLKKAPWFIGEYFLSIRPWVPDFRPDTTNISSVVVWVRLPKLPIEYYDAEALKEIGQAIGTILRIDTHTVLETRGRYARLSVQVDINKLLIYTILIGGFHQAVVYKGINNLYFSCGRLGHRREACHYTIQTPTGGKSENIVPSSKDDENVQDDSTDNGHALVNGDNSSTGQ